MAIPFEISMTLFILSLADLFISCVLRSVHTPFSNFVKIISNLVYLEFILSCTNDLVIGACDLCTGPLKSKRLAISFLLEPMHFALLLDLL